MPGCRRQRFEKDRIPENHLLLPEPDPFSIPRLSDHQSISPSACSLSQAARIRNSLHGGTILSSAFLPVRSEKAGFVLKDRPVIRILKPNFLPISSRKIQLAPPSRTLSSFHSNQDCLRRSKGGTVMKSRVNFLVTDSSHSYPKIYFTTHPADFPACFEEIVQDLFRLLKCTIYFDSDPDHPGMQRTLFLT